MSEEALVELVQGLQEQVAKIVKDYENFFKKMDGGVPLPTVGDSSDIIYDPTDKSTSVLDRLKDEKERLEKEKLEAVANLANITDKILKFEDELMDIVSGTPPQEEKKETTV